MQQPVTRAMILLCAVGLAYADSSTPSTKPPRQMLSEWRLGWPAKLPCRDFSSLDVTIEEPIDLVLHGKQKPLMALSQTGGVAIGAWHGPAGANRRYTLPADFDVIAIERVTASRADGVMLSFNCREKQVGDVTWTLTFRKDAFGDVMLKSDAQLTEPALCREPALDDKGSAAAEQKALESVLAELAHAVCHGAPCNDAARAILAAPMQAGEPNEVVADSQSNGWRARFVRTGDSLQCRLKKDRFGDERECVLTIGKISLRESCWHNFHDPPHWVVSASFALELRAHQASGEALWLNLSSDVLEAAHR